MKKWYVFTYFWRRGDADGDDTPQDRDDGTGDLIFNTMSKIENDGDSSEWAIKSFMTCASLLRSRNRWPDDFNKGDEAPNRYFWYINKWLRLGIWKYRSQNDMTRDPYIAFGAAYAMLMRCVTDVDDLFLIRITFKSIKLPWYLYRPNTWTWWRRLKKDNRKHFVKRLTYLKARGTVHHYRRVDHDEFYKDTP